MHALTKWLPCLLALWLTPAGVAQPAPPVDYTYRAQLVRVVDGDTVVLDIDLGFRVWVRERIRLLSVFAAESKEPHGQEHTAHLAALLPAGAPIIVQTQHDKTDGYGRMLGHLWVDGKDVNEAQSKFIGAPEGRGVKQ